MMIIPSAAMRKLFPALFDVAVILGVGDDGQLNHDGAANLDDVGPYRLDARMVEMQCKIGLLLPFTCSKGRAPWLASSPSGGVSSPSDG
jgi:hypothetical protein